MIHNSLFISNFKKIMKRALPVAIVIALLVLGCRVLNYLYVEIVDTNEWTRILWHNFYDEEENIDNLYLGSSHVYCSLNPTQMDDLTGKNNFNLSSPAQRLNGSYYLLKEAGREHDLEHVYVELYYDVSTGREGDFKVEGLGANWFNSDYMKNSLNRFEFLLTMSDKKNYLESLMPFIRYRSKLFDTEYVQQQIDKKSGIDYQNYQHTQQNEKGFVQYMDKGYYYSTLELSTEDLLLKQTKVLGDENPVSQDAEKYLRKIMEYCKENEIELTLFSAPVYELQVLTTENYDTYIKYIRAIADEYGVEYYDFNLSREEYLPIQHTEYFGDKEHLNSAGAEMFTKFFWQVMQGTAEENEKYFYPSYSDKRQETEGYVYGILEVAPLEGSEGLRQFKVASNWSENIEYQIYTTPEDGDTVMLQDFSENPYFTVTPEETGVCRIEARKTGEETPFQTIDIKY